jgi:Holliday junction resolvasome RuvABC endonuclease subunit
VIAIGIDGGLAELGFAVFDASAGQVLRTGVYSTKKETKKRKLHVGSDDARRIDLLAGHLGALFAEWSPSLVGYELPAAAKGARAGHALGIAHALVRLSARLYSATVPLVEVTVGDARRACCPRLGRVAEHEAHAALVARFDLAPTLEAHELDALAVAIAALDTPIGDAVRSSAGRRVS